MRMVPTQLHQQVLWCHCWRPHPELKAVHLKEMRTLQTLNKESLSHWFYQSCVHEEKSGNSELLLWPNSKVL